MSALPRTNLTLTGGLALFAVLMLSVSAGAIPLTEWGTRTTASSANCPSFCTDFDFGPTGGGYNVASAFTSQSDAQGNAQASAVLDPGSGLSVPVLRAEAYAGSGQGSAFGTAWGVEGYTYEGAEAKDFTLDFTLTGSAFDDTPAGTDTDIRADIWVFTTTNFELFFDIPTLLFEFFAMPKQDINGFDSNLSLSILGQDPVNSTPDSGSITFNLVPGEQVYLWASLGADAEQSSTYADAFSTLTTSFADSGGLTAASTVPEPGTLLLLGMGLAGLAGSGARRS